MDKQVADSHRQSGKAKQINLSPGWLLFIEYCRNLGYGVMDTLQIQDGVPVSAEKTKEKVSFRPKT